MPKSIGCIGCLTICCAMVRNHGSSLMKALFRNGRRHTVARSNAGHAQASTSIAEIAWDAWRSVVMFSGSGVNDPLTGHIP